MTIQKYWLFVAIAWTIHNVEEFLTMPQWIGAHESQLPFNQIIPLANLQQSFPIGLLIVTLLLIIIPLLAIRRKWDNRVLGVVLGIFLVNAVQHIAVSLALRTYSPGVITALLINLPLSIAILRQLFKQKLLKNFSWIHVILLGIIGFFASISVLWVVALAIHALGVHF
ncbi:MAG: HXXEE domain-containing protein [Bacteroidales bacterium]|jgi:hypothetical protein|nr:HXXEE domain-containing protein [Bacteroidales bacterium]